MSTWLPASLALAIGTKVGEKHKSATPSAVQMKNQ
jgi:hypothetical protein